MYSLTERSLVLLGKAGHVCGEGSEFTMSADFGQEQLRNGFGKLSKAGVLRGKSEAVRSGTASRVCLRRDCI